MTLGEKLYKLRKDKSISYDELAYEIEVSKTAIIKWETNKAKPSVENLLKLCNYYETDFYDLMEDVSNINFSGAKFKGSSYVVNPNNSTINFSNSLMLRKKKLSNIQFNIYIVDNLYVIKQYLCRFFRF
jgi:transcriptional regulator with XRE-family HTH domain